MADKNKPPKKAVETLTRKARRFHNLFTSPDGVKVLENLDDEFNPDVLFGKDDAETNYNVGRRDVVIYIRQMIRYQENVARAKLEG